MYSLVARLQTSICPWERGIDSKKISVVIPLRMEEWSGHQWRQGAPRQLQQLPSPAFYSYDRSYKSVGQATTAVQLI